MKTCSVAGCDAKSKCRGMCNRHHLKWWQYGNPLAGVTNGPRGEGSLHSDGYRRIGNKLVHREIAAKKLGRDLLPQEVVHHIDGNGLNNDPANLHVFASQSEHAAHHNAERRRIK